MTEIRGPAQQQASRAVTAAVTVTAADTAADTDTDTDTGTAGAHRIDVDKAQPRIGPPGREEEVPRPRDGPVEGPAEHGRLRRVRARVQVGRGRGRWRRRVQAQRRGGGRRH